MYESWNLDRLERKLQQIEDAGLESTEEFILLNELADQKAEARLTAIAITKQQDKDSLLHKNAIVAAIEAGNQEAVITLGGEEFIKDYDAYKRDR